MKRRTFLQSVFTSLVLPFLPKTRKETKTKKPVFADGNFTTTFCGRQIRADGRRIYWSKLGDSSVWNKIDFIDLPTVDACSGLCQDYSAYKLYWLGMRETWEIAYTGDLDLVFMVTRIV
jgi:hypothetical protein